MGTFDSLQNIRNRFSIYKTIGDNTPYTAIILKSLTALTILKYYEREIQQILINIKKTIITALKFLKHSNKL